MTRTVRQRARLSRSKGHAWERDVAQMFAAVYPDRDVRRCIAQSRMAAREGCDVEGTPFWIECKVGARLDLAGALWQADADTDGRPPIVVAKQTRRPPVVHGRLFLVARMQLGISGGTAPDLDPPITMALDAFLALLRQDTSEMRS